MSKSSRSLAVQSKVVPSQRGGTAQQRHLAWTTPLINVDGLKLTFFAAAMQLSTIHRQHQRSSTAFPKLFCEGNF